MKRLKLLIFVFLIVGGILLSAQNAKAQTGYMISSLKISGDALFGYSATNIYDYNFAYYCRVGVTGSLYDQNYNCVDYGSRQNVNPYAEVYTMKTGTVRGQEYKLISNHTLYAQFYRYTEEQQILFSDPYGVSGSAGGDNESPYPITSTGGYLRRFKPAL